MNPQKKRKINEFTDLVNIMLDQGGVDFPITQLEDEANKIKPYSYTEWKMALGMVEALKYNAQGVITNFEAAIKAGGESLVYSNYASANLNICHVIKGNEIIEEALTYFQDFQINLDALDIFVKIHKLDRAKQLIETLNDSIESTTLSKYRNQIEMLENLYRDKNVTWQDTAARLQAVREFISSKTNNIRRLTESIYEDNIFYEFYINEEIEKIAEIELLLNDYLASSEYHPIDLFLSFALVKQ